MIGSSTKELTTPFENPESVFRSKRRLFKKPSLVESSLLELDLFSDVEEHPEEETTEIMTEIMDQYMSKTRGDYGSGVVRPKINDKTHFELKGQYLKKLRENTLSSSEHEDANEHIEKVLEIIYLFHIPEVGCELCKGPNYTKDCPLKEKDLFCENQKKDRERKKKVEKDKEKIKEEAYLHTIWSTGGSIGAVRARISYQTQQQKNSCYLIEEEGIGGSSMTKSHG
ncbi:hypothetical protein Tco_1346136 [Tanacetum coccineum]